MKKLFTVSIIIALVLLAISCDGNTRKAESVALSTIRASIDSVVSRNISSSSRDVSFEDGDEIGVSLDFVGDVKYTYESNTNTFSPALNPVYFEDKLSHTIRAYYPYGTSTLIDTTQAEVTDILYASTTGNYKDGASFTGDGAFKHLLSKITITFAPGNGVKEEDLKAKGLSYTISDIETTGTFDKSKGTIANNTTKGTVTASIAAGSTSLTSSLLLLPQTVANIPISVSYNEQTYSGTLTITELKEGTNHNFTVKVSNTGLSIKTGVEITDWTDGDSTTETVTLSSSTTTDNNAGASI